LSGKSHIDRFCGSLSPKDAQGIAHVSDLATKKPAKAGFPVGIFLTDQSSRRSTTDCANASTIAV
jgi:hypothetical protein